MIKKSEDYHGFTASCDNCGEIRFYGEENTFTIPWKQLIALMKNDGWAITNLSGEWGHVCPGCRGKE